MATHSFDGVMKEGGEVRKAHNHILRIDPMCVNVYSTYVQHERIKNLEIMQLKS